VACGWSSPQARALCRRRPQWHQLAQLLAQRQLEAYASITSEAVSALVRGEGVPIVDVKTDPTGAPRWQVHGVRTLYDDPWVRLTQGEVEPPDGTRWWHHVVRLRPIAAAAVLNDHDQVLMLWRHRFVPDALGWELPGGVIDAGESGAIAARRETEEETGWRPIGEPEHLCTFEPMPGMVDARHEVYLVRGAEFVREPTDAQEAGRVAWVPLPEIPELVRRGEVTGAGSLVGLLYLLALRGLER